MSERVLVCWVGLTDLRCAEGKEPGLGPVGQALSQRQFDRAHLLANCRAAELKQYLAWLKPHTAAKLETALVDLVNPMDFGRVYKCAVDAIESTLKAGKRGAAKGDAQLTFHISPGTPAMAAVWVILAKTRFPAELIASTKDKGVYTASVPFDISAEYIGDLLSEPDSQLTQQSQAKPPESAEFQEIVGRCTSMREVIAKAQKVAARSIPVLIEGESGTGKELFARAIHGASPRRSKPFIAVNCGAIPKDLVESELFGHKKGTFTGAEARLGHFREANGGTLFLDELGELPKDSQVKLLRVLQEGAVTPLGESRPYKVDVRVIAATNRDVAGLVQQGLFREDLFYRLAVAVLKLPPLREREGDLNEVVNALLDRINHESASEPGYRSKKLSPGARNVIHAHSWPGNVRELQNTLMRAAIWSEGEVISKAELEAALLNGIARSESTLLNRTLGSGFDLRAVLDEVSRHYLKRALAEANGNKTLAADLTGLKTHQTLTDWMERLGVDS